MSNRDPLEELSHYGSPVEWSAYKIVTRHPLADEVAVLRRLGMTPGDCRACDAYWAVDEHLVLVSIEASPAAQPTATYHVKGDESRARSFYVRTRTSPLYTSTINATLTALKCWIEEHAATFEGLEPGLSIRVGEGDLLQTS